jgi:hypothetical protein
MTESKALVAALFVMTVGAVGVVDALGETVDAIGEVGVPICAVDGAGVGVVLLFGVTLVAASVGAAAKVGAVALLLAALAVGELLSVGLVWVVAGSTGVRTVFSVLLFCSMGGK